MWNSAGVSKDYPGNYMREVVGLQDGDMHTGSTRNSHP